MADGNSARISSHLCALRLEMSKFTISQQDKRLACLS